MDLRAELKIQAFCQRKSTPDNLSPVFYRIQITVDHGHLRSKNMKAETVCQAHILLQPLHSLFGSENAVLQNTTIYPMPVFHRFYLILFAKREPFVYPVVRRIRVVFDMCVCKDLDAVGTHILQFFKAILKCLFKAKFRGIAVESNTSLRTFLFIMVHLSYLHCMDCPANTRDSILDVSVNIVTLSKSAGSQMSANRYKMPQHVGNCPRHRFPTLWSAYVSC